VLKQLILLVAGAGLSVLGAVPPSIGVVTSAGEFRLDGAPIRGDSTLFDGNVIETSAARSVARLSGAQVTLLPDSRARIFTNRAVLEKGSGIVAHAPKLILETDSLRIAPSAEDSIVQVERTTDAKVVVATRGGPAEVRTASGLLIGVLKPDMALAFDLHAASGQPASASGAVKLSGVVSSAGGKFFLTDRTTGVKVELRGEELAKYNGRTVVFQGSVIPGATPAGGATQVVQVVTIEVAKAAATPAAAAGAGSGGALSPMALGAYIGGVAVTLTMTSLYSVGAFDDVRPLSRP